MLPSSISLFYWLSCLYPQVFVYYKYNYKVFGTDAIILVFMQSLAQMYHYYN